MISRLLGAVVDVIDAVAGDVLVLVVVGGGLGGVLVMLRSWNGERP